MCLHVCLDLAALAHSWLSDVCLLKVWEHSLKRLRNTTLDHAQQQAKLCDGMAIYHRLWVCSAYLHLTLALQLSEMTLQQQSPVKKLKTDGMLPSNP